MSSAVECNVVQYEWRKAELIGQLLNLGVTPGGVLLVHSSFRSVRPLEDGPLGLIEALRAALGPGGRSSCPRGQVWTTSRSILPRRPLHRTLELSLTHSGACQM